MVVIVTIRVRLHNYKLKLNPVNISLRELSHQFELNYFVNLFNVFHLFIFLLNIRLFFYSCSAPTKLRNVMSSTHCILLFYIGF